MNATGSITREFRFILRQPFLLLLFGLLVFLSSYAIWAGLAEVQRQHTVIERLVAADDQERAVALAKQSDYGGAAYYSFHLTYDPPSSLTFAALGVRDVYPWKHRIRMLALEGQIYENDAANAELTQAGRFDFAFIVSVIAPLFLIILLHDQHAAEREAGRHDLLVATAGNERELWLARSAVRVGLLCVALLVPFLFGAVRAGSSASGVVQVCLVVCGLVLFWAAICLWASKRPYRGPAIASGLVTFWILTTFVVPPIGEAVIEKMIPVSTGNEIVLTQRETVNDAWDLPKQATMEAFVEQHPQWSEYATVKRPFEWKWYYAFQQVGDQTVQQSSKMRRNAIAARDSAATWVALLSPSSLVERALTEIAETNIKAALAYQQQVRDFHADLRHFYYPFLFQDAEYDKAALANLPRYKPKI